MFVDGDGTLEYHCASSGAMHAAKVSLCLMLEEHEAQRVEDYGALPLLPSPGLCVERKQQKEQAAVAEVMIVVAMHPEKNVTRCRISGRLVTRGSGENCHSVPYLWKTCHPVDLEIIVTRCHISDRLVTHGSGENCHLVPYLWQTCHPRIWRELTLSAVSLEDLSALHLEKTVTRCRISDRPVSPASGENCYSVSYL